MCDPLTLGVAAAGIGAAGSLYSGAVNSQSYKDQARFADRQAVMENQAGAYEVGRIRSQGSRVLASMRQQFVSAGIDPTAGSAREVIADSARELALDEEAVRFGADVKSGNLRFSARLARNNAQSAAVGSVIDAAGAVTGGIADAWRTKLTNPYLQMGGLF